MAFLYPTDPIVLVPSKLDLDTWNSIIAPPEPISGQLYSTPPPFGGLYTKVQRPPTQIHPSLDLNYNPEIHDNITRYFYYKMLDKWLSNDKQYNDLIAKLNKSGNTYKFGASGSNNPDQIRDKRNYIEQYVLSVGEVKHALTKFVQRYNVNWYDLPKSATYSDKPNFEKEIKAVMLKLLAESLAQHR